MNGSSAIPVASRALDRFVPNPKLRFLDQCREVLRYRQLAYRTEQSYVDWIRRFILLCGAASEKGSSTLTQLNSAMTMNATGHLNRRTNNALVQSFTVNNLNQLSNATRSGTLTVAGATHGPATSVTVNGLSATRYADATFARDGFTLANGTNRSVGFRNMKSRVLQSRRAEPGLSIGAQRFNPQSFGPLVGHVEIATVPTVPRRETQRLPAGGFVTSAGVQFWIGERFGQERLVTEMRLPMCGQLPQGQAQHLTGQVGTARLLADQ